MDDQNTPFVTDPAWDTVEGYEKLEVPDITKGRSGVLIEGTQIFTEALEGQTVNTGFLEGPLLT
jgi:uroporphyrinogen decarboxylase